MNNSKAAILWQAPHIRLLQPVAGRLCLIVTGMELNDFVEEHLWDEFEFSATAVTLQEGTNWPVYTNEFDAGVPVQRVIELLNGLDRKEVERISPQNS